MEDYQLYLGASGEGEGKGISTATFNIVSGELSKPKFDIEAAFPEFFIIHPNKKFLYATIASSAYEKTNGGGLAAYAIDASSGHLTKLNSKPSGGATPCFLSFDKRGKYLLASNYHGGNIVIYAIEPDGSLGKQTAFVQHEGAANVVPERQDKAYAHSIVTDPTNRFVIAADLGTDKLVIYRFDEKEGTLAPANPPFTATAPGAGPRHITFSSDGKFAYVINELNNTISVYSWDDTGLLKELQSLPTLPKDFTGATKTAEIGIHPSGNFLYGTNRGHNSIVVCQVDKATGLLTFVERVDVHGNFPRYFEFDPSGKWLLVNCHLSETLSIFSIDQKTGKLSLHGKPIKVPGSFCIRFFIP